MMKRDVSQFRRSLAKRKAEKLRAIQNRSASRPVKPIVRKINPSHQQTEQTTPVFVRQLIASGFVFLAVLFFNQFKSPANDVSQWVTDQLREDFPFATVNVWYQEQFGSPLGFFVEESRQVVPNQQVIPVNGVINQSYDLNGQGLMIETADQPEVYAIDQGVVLFAGNDRTTGKTVVIQHPDRTKSTYGFLADIDVRPYQFIQASQQIGATSSDATVFFAVQRGMDYLDPNEVISIDGLE
ncbi:hypothetical protein GCM10022410_08890 [Amphibacillus indicireducens]|uniref:M23ase beta-sheet core domain-containing protein n=2 Tax=Amphibacillus indicireducens TaxID=1076330 RepID=A0ABP7VCR0_9BACI